MLNTVLSIALVTACLGDKTFDGVARYSSSAELKESSRNSPVKVPSQVKALASLLAALDHTAGFQVAGHGRSPLLNKLKGTSAQPHSRGSAYIDMQLNDREVTRRAWLALPLAVAALSVPTGSAFAETAAPAAPVKSNLGYDVTPMSSAEVDEKAKKLTNFQRQVALQARTERPFTGSTTNGYAHDNKEEGYYAGSVSGLPLFSSKAKYESGSGWPSFYAAVDPKHVILRQDPDDLKDPVRAARMGGVRIEVLDAVSGTHLGHVFDDGPYPTGKRFCMNAAALTFVPSKGGVVPKGA